MINTFTVRYYTGTYQFEQGQTWQQWISSNYNSSNWVVKNNTVRINDTGAATLKLWDNTGNYTEVLSSDLVVDNGDYEFNNEIE